MAGVIKVQCCYVHFVPNGAFLLAFKEDDRTRWMKETKSQDANGGGKQELKIAYCRILGD